MINTHTHIKSFLTAPAWPQNRPERSRLGWTEGRSSEHPASRVPAPLQRSPTAVCPLPACLASLSRWVPVHPSTLWSLLLEGRSSLLSVCLWLSLRPLGHRGVLQGREGMGPGVRKLARSGGLTAGPPSSPLPLPSWAQLPERGVGGSIKDHTWFVLPPCLFHSARTQVLLSARAWLHPAERGC